MRPTACMSFLNSLSIPSTFSVHSVLCVISCGDDSSIKSTNLSKYTFLVCVTNCRSSFSLGASVAWNKNPPSMAYKTTVQVNPIWEKRNATNFFRKYLKYLHVRSHFVSLWLEESSSPFDV